MVKKKVNKETKLCRGEWNILPWGREELPPNEWPPLRRYILTGRRDALVQNNRRRFIMKICCCCCCRYFSTSSPLPPPRHEWEGRGSCRGALVCAQETRDWRVAVIERTNRTRWWAHGVWMLCLKQPFKSVFFLIRAAYVGSPCSLCVCF